MNELLNMATSHVNIVLTFLLVFTLIYWLLMIIGLVDLESVDLDIDVDSDIDIDVDADIDLDIDADADLDIDSHVDAPEVNTSSGKLEGLGDGLAKEKNKRKWYFGPLAFLGVGTIPVMILLSILFLSMWTISIIITQKFGIQSWTMGLLSLPLTFLGGLAITKIAGMPLHPLFRKMKEGKAKEINFIGKTCEVVISADNNTLGQASVLINGDVIKVSVKSTNELLHKGDKALIIDEFKEKNYYLIEKFENL